MNRWHNVDRSWHTRKPPAKRLCAQVSVDRAMRTSHWHFGVALYLWGEKNAVCPSTRTTSITPAAESAGDVGRVQWSKSMLMAPACRSLRSPESPLDNFATVTHRSVNGGTQQLTIQLYTPGTFHLVKRASTISY